jgi:hypothetical protein
MERRWSIWLNATCLLLASVIAVASLSLRLPPDVDVAAVIFPPWWNARQTMSAAATADAAIIRTGIIPAILIVQPAKQDGLSRLREAGIWFAVNPQAIAACFTN